MAKRDFNITNAPEVAAALNGLSERLKNTWLRKAVNAALSPVVATWKKFATPLKRSGFYRKSINKKVKTYPSGITVGLAGPAKDTVGSYRGKRVVPAFYAHLVELGTKPHRQPKLKTTHPGAKPRYVKARSWAAVKEQVVGIVAETLKAELNKGKT